MTQLAAFPDFSWRADPLVPQFQDTGTIAFMDGECVLCMAGARMIDRFDRSGRIGISPTQSRLGHAILLHYGMSPEDPDSWLVLDRGHAYTALDAIIQLGRRMGGTGQVLKVLGIFPSPFRDWLYRRIARNRFAIMGRRQTCDLPTASLRARLVGPN